MSTPRADSAPAAPRELGAHPRPGVPNLVRRIAAGLTALAFSAGLALVGVAAPASAHSVNVSGAAECEADGTYTITWKVKTSNVPSNTEGEVKVIAPVNEWLFEWAEHRANHGLPALKPNDSFTWVQAGADGGDTTASATFQIDWKDGYSHDPSKTMTLAGDCGEGTVKKITFCHATGSESNPYERITTSVNAFLNAGHLDHQDHRDIYPAFSYEKKGVIHHVPAQGDQSLLLDEECEGPRVIPVGGEPAFSDACGPDNEQLTLPVDTDMIEWSSVEADGTVTVTATPKTGYAFPEGSQTSWEFPIDDSPCLVDVVGAPSFSDACGPDNEQLIVPVDTDMIDWSSVEADGTVTVTATPKTGYAFPEGSQTSWEFPIDDAPCVIEVEGAPSFSDACGPDNEQLIVPEDTDTVEWSSVEADGTVTVTATAKPGSTFPEGAHVEWSYTIDDSPCVVELVGEPSFSDTCGPDNEQLTVPEDTDTVEWSSVEADGTVTVTAAAEPGLTFPQGVVVTWTYAVDDEPCIEPSLAGSVVTGVCLADAPWIFYEIMLTDPDNQSDADAASLVFADGVNTETVPLGALDENGVLEGEVLWPGASVADDGVTPSGWPGWAFVDGEWVETEDNFGWTLASMTATLVVNPDLEVAIAYPPATPDCAAAPPQDDLPGAEVSSPSGVGLASTGFAGTTIAIIAGVIVVAGLAFLVIARVRRNRS